MLVMASVFTSDEQLRPPTTQWCQILAPKPQGRDQKLRFHHLILAPNCHIYISPLTTKSIQDHWMGHELNTSSLSHQVSWDGPRSSLTIPHLSVNIHTDFPELPFQTPANAMPWVLSQRDRRSTGVDQLQPAEVTSWRLGPKLSS